MESTIYSTEGLKNLFVSVLDTLTPKEQEVIIRRVGLNGQKETLQNI
jgi:DNA-directed RNA polymerase sigma subunit (sigma70/sigma32)